jgi:excisionase family DNA binding protein
VSIADQLKQSDHCFTAAELAKLLNVCKITIHRHIKAGRLKAFHVGSALRIQPSAAADWLRDRGETVQ